MAWLVALAGAGVRPGFRRHPLIDGKTLICLAGGDTSLAAAFDKGTRKETLARSNRGRALSEFSPGENPHGNEISELPCGYAIEKIGPVSKEEK